VSPVALWRVFPWDPAAKAGRPFSPSYLPAPTARGRFDLPARLASVVYLAETPEHAVAELLHPWRGRTIDRRHLERAGRRLAAIEVRAAVDPLADLCDPGTLVRLGIAPDRVASRHRAVTQPIARVVWDAGHAGLRWWSRFWGDWHTTVVFVRRAADGGDGGGPTPELTFGEPEPLSPSSRAVVEAARSLGIEITLTPR
jgi:hypothetical protein